MRYITTEEYQERVNKLYESYGDMLEQAYGLCTPYGWLSTIEDMFIQLDVSLKSESLNKIRFLDIKNKYATARFHWAKTKQIDKDDNQRAIEIINYYEELASTKCEVCGLPGIELIKAGYTIRLCPAHFDIY